MFKKTLMVGVAALAFASAAFANPYNNASNNNGASGAVNSQSFATATSSGNGTAFTATQSGSFATFGQVSTYTPATNTSTGGTSTIGGTASVAGFTATSGYVTSESITTGNASASSQSWNSAVAAANSYQNTNLPGYTGAASGAANSASGGSASTSSNGDHFSGVEQIQGNSESNLNAYSASDSGIQYNSTVTVNGTTVPVTNVQTQTSATAQSDSSVANTTVFGSTPVANVGTGGNSVTANSGTATADAN
jgi:hypothetical protein